MANDIELLRTTIQAISKAEKIDEEKAFIYWIFKYYYDLEEPDYYEYITDGGNDKRIDAFIPYEQERLVLIQGKYFQNLNKQISEADVALFYSCIVTLKNPSQLSPKSPLLNVAEVFDDIMASEGEIELHYFTTGTFNESAIRERITFNNLPDYEGKVQLYFHDLNDLLNTLQASLADTNPLTGEIVDFPIVSNQYFLNDSGIFPSYICSIRANFLVDLYKKYSNRLFDRNIRYYKGTKSGSINAKIVETIGDKKERKHFWYYNNGVTIVCNKLNPPEKSKDGQMVIKIDGPQIINGCQTTVSLFDAYEKYYQTHQTEFFDNDKKLPHIPNDVNLLVRFIQASPKNTDLITLYTNSQNPVSAYQLRSNDDIQQNIKKQLSTFVSPYFYEIKEGERRLQKDSIKTLYNNRVIEMVQTAQAIYAAKFDPAYARRFKKNLFSDHYTKIFRKDITSYEILLPNLILNQINSLIKDFKTEEFAQIKISTTEQNRIEDIKSREFLLYSNLIYLYFIWALINKKYGRYDRIIAEKLLNNRLKDRIKIMFDYITTVLKYNNELKNTNPQRYLKNLKNIDLLKDELLKEVEKDAAKGKNPLNDFLPNIDVK